MRNLLIETQTGKPAPRQMHAQLFDQLALAADAIQVADQQAEQQNLGINRRTAGLTVTLLQLFPPKPQTEVFFDEPQKMILTNLIFQAKVIEQPFRQKMLPHHN